jgi:hypothetical protein
MQEHHGCRHVLFHPVCDLTQVDRSAKEAGDPISGHQQPAGLRACSERRERGKSLDERRHPAREAVTGGHRYRPVNM